MKKYTLLDSIRDWWYGIEYRFAKRWLDRNFGEQEYWGDFLMEKLYPPKN